MPRYSQPDDYRRETIIYILIGAFGNRPFERLQFHAVAKCYVEECEKRGVADIGFYFDIVTDTCPSVDDAVSSAIEYGFMRCVSKEEDTHTSALSARMLHRLTTEQSDLSQADAEIAKAVAREKVEAFASGKIRPRWKAYRPEEHPVTDD
ncbi:MAG: hypothetical protein JWN50_791 [Parcubacteria group bacterium]|nr:hypothetical protein [Parcubacteria group bacterium]